MSQINTAIGRVSTLLSSNQLLARLRNTQTRLLDVQDDISTGIKISRPSDAPSDTSAILKLQGQLEARQQHEQNLRFGLTLLNNTDQGLSDAFNIVLDAKSIASSQIGVGSDTTTRQAQSVNIDAQIQELVRIANREIQDIALFGGQQSTQTTGALFVEFLGGIQYVGSTEDLKGDFGLSQPLAINTNGQDAFGALSTRIKGSVDLNPGATAATFLKDVNGAQGVGIRKGSITVTVGASSTNVDLTTAETLGDVTTRINDAITTLGGGGSVSVSGSGFVVTPGGTTTTISDIGTGQTAADLGINVSATVPPNLPVAGADIDPKLTELTTLASLGVAVDLVNGLKITQGNQTKTADFSTATTIQDAINVIDQLQLGLRLEINAAGTGLDLISEVSGIDLSIGENSGGTTAGDLGLRSFGTATLLSDFQNGVGVTGVTGQDDFAIELHNGTTFNVNIDGDATVSDLLATIQTAATGAGLTVGTPGTGGTDFNVGLALDGNGLTFEDGTAGASAFRVVQLGTSLAATHLGINTDAGTGNSIIGQDVAQVRVDSLFTHMIKLRDALVNDSSTGITFAGEGLEKSLDGLVRIRATVGVRSRQVESEQERSAELKITEQTFLSELRDTDLTEAITKLAQLQQQLEAGLLVGSQNLQLSLLSFLR